MAELDDADELEQEPRYSGAHRAFVRNPTDPENLGRPQVSVPEVSGDGLIGERAWPVHPWPGMRPPPPSGTAVVIFLNGDPSHPAYLGTWHGAVGEVHADLQAAGAYGFPSPLGHVVILDDAGDKVVVKHRNGQVVRILADGTVEVGTPSGRVKLAGGGARVARDGDPVQVSVPPGTFGNPTEVTLDGIITDGSAKVESG